MLYDVIILDK